MERDRYDAIVIGSGHNGLTNAGYLARAGLSVLVVERNDYIGGAAVSRELQPGWTYTNCSYVCSLLRPEIIRDLELAKYGLQVIPYGGGATLKRDGDAFSAYTDHDALRRELARHSPKDADAYERYSVDVMRQCRFIRPLLMRMPPDPTSFKPRDLMELLFIGKRFWDLGERDMSETVRFWTLSIADYLDQYFESDVVKAHLAGSGIIGTALGPYSPGTAYVLLHHYMGEVDGSIGSWGFSRGGMGAITQAMTRSLEAHGGEVRTGSGVERILVEEGRAAGVALSNGDVYRAKTVISGMDVKRTFLEAMDANDLPVEFLDQVRRFKIRGSSGKLNIALDGLPEFPQIATDSSVQYGEKHFTETVEDLERAYDDWKAGTWSRWPYIDMLIPSQFDPTVAPPGKHMLTAFIQYAPPTLKSGEPWDGAAREAFGKTVIDEIATFSPNFKDLIVHAEVRTPWDLEQEVGLTEGNIFQGELTFDQLLFNRPVPGYAQYRMPVPGLYLCGSSAHPGGGVMGAPGANAAREVLRDLRAPQTVREMGR